MSQPMLTGVRVIDMTSVVFGPFATQALADLGADVIKVEAPEGDGFRFSGKPATTSGMSPGHMHINRGKRSIALDLKTQADADVMRELLRTADILIHNVRLDAIRRLGFGPDEVRALAPNIIYVHCVGFGSGGPYQDLQAYDDVIQAATGTVTLAARVAGNATPRYVPSLIADKVAGLLGAQAALAAYVHKLRTGEGQFVEVPMFEGFAHFMLAEHLGGLTFDPPNAPVCYARQIDPDRQPFPTRDGWISLVPYTLRSWPTVFDVLEDAAFLKQPDFATPKAFAASLPLLYRRVAELTPARTSADWVERFNAARIPCMAVRDIGDILDDPHLSETFFIRREHPSEGRFVQMRPPIRFGAFPGHETRPAPRLDEHGAEIRAELAAARGKSPS